MGMEMKKPKYLKKGDRVAIVSPSGAIAPEFIDGAADTLRDWGFEPVIGEHAKMKCGRFAGLDADRAADLQWAMDSKDIRAILCGRGGYGLVRIIDKLSFKAMKRNPKWLIGFSDITALHSALLNNGIESLHAVMAKALAHKDNNMEAAMAVKNFLLGKLDNEVVDMTPHRLNKFGESHGRLVGGNLSVLYGLRSTPFDINPDGAILFIEDLAERPYHIDRMMQNLRLSGVLERISGLLVGRFSDIEEDASFGQTVEEIICSATEGYSYPVAFNFPVGHVSYNMPMRLGADVKMSVGNKGSYVDFL